MRALFLVALLVLAPGCAAWGDYNSDTRKARRDFEAGSASSALERLAGETDNELDGLCFTLERAVMAQAAGLLELSRRDFEKAERQVEAFEDRGLSPVNASEYAGAIFVNDKMIPYQGESFERVLIPVFNCRNYLLEGRLEDAMVEVRRIWKQQDIAKQLHQKELADSQQQAADHHVDTRQLPGVERQVVYPPGALASPESIYEVTYAHWLAALVSEATGHLDDARISLESVAKVRPDLAFVQRDLARLSGGDERCDDGSVALLFDCGWAPHKAELKVVFPTYHSIGAVAIPIYERSPNPVARARLRIGDRTFETAVLSDVESIAFKHHKDRLPVIVTRQAIRAAVKIAAGEATAYGVKEGLKSGKGKGRRGAAQAEIAGWAAGLAVGVYNWVSEQADLRAWLSLPQTFQGTRAFLPPGEHPATLELIGFSGEVVSAVDIGPVKVTRGKISFIVARSVGTTVYVTKR